MEGLAAVYSDKLAGRKTASGEVLNQSKLTAAHPSLAFGKSLRRRSPRSDTEMGPCQNARNACRRNGGRVYAADGSEVTQADEAEYDKKVTRVRVGP